MGMGQLSIGCCNCGGGPGGSGVVGTIPFCFCTDIPAALTMTSVDETCNFDMFQNCTIVYGLMPEAFLPTAIGTYSFLSTEGFPDPVADGAIFYYLLTCEYNQWFLSRVYLESPYGSPFRDGILWTWTIGSTGSTCSPFALLGGVGFPGTDVSCGVSIEG